MDFMGFFPTMTHLFDYKKLNPQFDWFLKTDIFSDKYSKYLPSRKNFHPKQSQLFINNLGQLRSLTDHELRNNHFWFNMINKNLSTHLYNMKVEKLFPYLPFIIKPKFKIFIDNKIMDKLPNCEYYHISLEIRLFPQSVSVIHIKAYFKGPFTIDDLVFLEKKFKSQRFLILNQLGIKKLNLNPRLKYSIQELFAAIEKTIWKTLYFDEVGIVDESAEIASCTVINPLAKFKLTKQGMTSLIMRSNNLLDNDIKEVTKNKLKKTRDPTDVIAYNDYTLLIYAPKISGKRLSCLRNNCINVLELAYVQDFFLSRVVDQFDKYNIWSSSEKKEYLMNLDYSAICAIVPSLSKHRENLHGIHRKLYNAIARKTKHKKLEEKILMSYKYTGLSKEITSQLKEPQKYLETIVTNSYDDKFEGDLFDAGKALNLQRLGDQIISGIKGAYNLALEEEGKINCDQNKLQDLFLDIDKTINEYRINYIPKYKNLVKDLVGETEKIKQKTEEKRKEGKEC